MRRSDLQTWFVGLLLLSSGALVADPGGFRFEHNHGQTDPNVRYVGRGPQFLVLLKDFEVSVAAAGARLPLHVRFVGAVTPGSWVAMQELPFQTNYYLGSDSSRWLRGVSNYARVKRTSLYPGIDLVFHYGSEYLEYDFAVQPGVDPAVIRLLVDGARRLSIDADGNLVAEADFGKFVQRRPRVYQEGAVGRTTVEGRWVRHGAREVGFEIGLFDRGRALVIDPVIEFASYIGGSGEDVVTCVTAGEERIVVGGYTNSYALDWVAYARPGALSGTDGFVMELNSEGRVDSLTYIGGAGDDRVNGVAGGVVTGETNSKDFPIWPASGRDQPEQTVYGGGASDAFIMTLVRGHLSRSEYFGGSGDDRGLGVAAGFDISYITGETNSSDLPVRRAVQNSSGGKTDAFVAVYWGGIRLLSTYLGGSGEDRGLAIAVANGIHVAGETNSPDFLTKNAFQPSLGGANDAFVVRLTDWAAASAERFRRGEEYWFPQRNVGFALGDAVELATYLGGDGDDRANSVTVDAQGRIYVAGRTRSRSLGAASPIQSVYGGGESDALLAVLTKSGQPVHGKHWGGSGSDEATAVALGVDGDVLIGGSTSSFDLKTREALQDRFGGGSRDGFLLHLNKDLELLQASYYGGQGADAVAGVASDQFGRVILAGRTDSADLRSLNGIRLGPAGQTDAFVATIARARIIARDWIVGKDLQAKASATLTLEAPAGGVDLTITSGDPSKLLISGDDTREGSGELVVRLGGEAGRQATFYLQALADSGEVSYTLSAPGYETRMAKVTLAPSGPMAFRQTPFQSFQPFGEELATSELTRAVPIRIGLSPLGPGLAQAAGPQGVRGGLGYIEVEMSSSDPAVGVAKGPELPFGPFTPYVSATFEPKAQGVTELVLRAAGFTATSRLIARVSAPSLRIPDLDVGQGLMTLARIDLSAGAPASGLRLTVQSADPTLVLVSRFGQSSGAGSVTLPIDPGSQFAYLEVHGLASSGTTRLRVTAPGWADGMATVRLTPSAVNIKFIADSQDRPSGWQPGDLLVRAFTVRVDQETNEPAEEQPLRRGARPITVELTNSNPQAGALIDRQFTLRAGAGELTAIFRPGNAGITELTAAVPEGYVRPARGHRLQIEVPEARLELAGALVGKNLQQILVARLTRPAPPEGLTVRFRSSDSNRVRLAPLSSEGPASGSLEARVPAQEVAVGVVATAVMDTGEVRVTAEAPGYRSASVTVRAGPSTFMLGTREIRTMAFGEPVQFSLQTVVLDPANGEPAFVQSPRPGMILPLVPLELSDKALGAVLGSPISVRDGARFQPARAGRGVLRLMIPEGWAPSPRGETPVVVEQSSPPIYGPAVLGKDLQAPLTVGWVRGAPSETEVTVVSTDPVRLLLATDPTRVGRESVTVRLNAGAEFPKVWVQGLASSGRVTIEARAAGFSTGRWQIRLEPSAFTIKSIRVNPQAPTTIDATTLDSPIQLRIAVAVQDLAGSRPAEAEQTLRGGLGDLELELENSDPSVGRLSVSRLFWGPGDRERLVEFRPGGVGTTRLGIRVPSGFVPAREGSQVTVNVRAPRLSLRNVVVGRNLQREVELVPPINLDIPEGRVATVTSEDPTRVLLSRWPNEMGRASLAVPFSRSSGQRFWVQGLETDATVTLRVSAEGFAESEAVAVVAGPTIIFERQGTVFVQPTEQVVVRPAVVVEDPDHRVRPLALLPGLGGAEVEVSSADPGIAAVDRPPVRIEAGQSYGLVVVRAVAPGRTTLTLKPPTGFESDPLGRTRLDVVVTSQ